jgi:hypothetical protein
MYLFYTFSVLSQMLSVIDWVQHYSESTLEKLWKEFQETLQEYINSTEDKRYQYAKLKAQDEVSSETISKQCKILTYFCVSVNCYTCDRFYVEWGDYVSVSGENKTLESCDYVL